MAVVAVHARRKFKRIYGKGPLASEVWIQKSDLPERFCGIHVVMLCDEDTGVCEIMV